MRRRIEVLAVDKTRSRPIEVKPFKLRIMNKKTLLFLFTDYGFNSLCLPPLLFLDSFFSSFLPSARGAYMLRKPMAWGAYMLRNPMAWGTYMLRKPMAWGTYMLRNPMAWGTYMLRKPFMVVFIRLRVRARHHGELLWK